jgi:kinetochore protein NDC80
MREEYHAVIHQAQDKLMGLQESLDRLSESLADKQDEVTQVEEKIKRIVQAYLTDKESYQHENKANGHESDELEQTIQRLRSDNSANLLHSQQRLQRVTIDYDQLVSRISEEKERIGNEIFRILEELINFKTHIETTLGDLENAYSKEIPNSK